MTDPKHKPTCKHAVLIYMTPSALHGVSDDFSWLSRGYDENRLAQWLGERLWRQTEQPADAGADDGKFGKNVPISFTQDFDDLLGNTPERQPVGAPMDSLVENQPFGVDALLGNQPSPVVSAVDDELLEYLEPPPESIQPVEDGMLDHPSPLGQPASEPEFTESYPPVMMPPQGGSLVQPGRRLMGQPMPSVEPSAEASEVKPSLEKPSVKKQSEPVEQPADGPGEKPPLDLPQVIPPVEALEQPSAEKLLPVEDESFERPGEQLVEQPVEALGKPSVEKLPVEEQPDSDEPQEQPEVLGKPSVEKLPVDEQPVDSSDEHLVEQPATDSEEQPVDSSSDEPHEQPATESDELGDLSDDELVNQPSKESVGGHPPQADAPEETIADEQPGASSEDELGHQPSESEEQPIDSLDESLMEQPLTESEEQPVDSSDDELVNQPSKSSVGGHLPHADASEENIAEASVDLSDEIEEQPSIEPSDLPQSSEVDGVAASAQSARLGVAIEFNRKRGMFERLIERYPGMRIAGLVREDKPDSLRQFLSPSIPHTTSVSGLADFLVWARTEIRAEHYTLVLLGDLGEVIESGERERENLRASRQLGAAMGLAPFTRHDDRGHPVLIKSKDGNDRPHPILGKSKDGNDRPHPILGKSKDGNDRPHPILGKSKDGNDRPHPILGKSKDGNDRPHPILGKSKDGNDRPHPILGKSKDGNDRPHPILGKSKDGNDRPLSYAMGVEQTDNVFSRARWLVEELRSAQKQLATLEVNKRIEAGEIDTIADHLIEQYAGGQVNSGAAEADIGEKVVDRIVADGCTLSYVEILAELASFADEVLTAQLPLPRLGGPLGTLLNHAELDLPSLVREFAGDCAAFKTSAAAHLDSVEPEASGGDTSILASAVENRPTSCFGLALDGTKDIVEGLDQLGAAVATAIEHADAVTRLRIYAVLAGLVWWNEPDDCSCDLGEMLHTISRATDARDGWTPGDALRDVVRGLRTQLRGVESVREGLPASYVGVNVFLPIRVEDDPSADYLHLDILRGTDLGSSSGWARMLAALRRIAFERELDARGQAAMAAERRMHQDMAAFWQRSTTVDNPQVTSARTRRGPRRHWGVLCYLSGFEQSKFAPLIGGESADFEVAFQFGMESRHTLGTLRDADEPAQADSSKKPTGELSPETSGLDPSIASSLADTVAGLHRLADERDSSIASSLADTAAGRHQLADVRDSSSIVEPSWSDAVRALREDRPSLVGASPFMDFYASDGIRRFIEWGVEACDARYFCLIVAVRHDAQPTQSRQPSTVTDPFVLLDDGDNHRRMSVSDFVQGVRAALKNMGRERLDLLVVQGVGEPMAELVHELSTVTRNLHWSLQSETSSSSSSMTQIVGSGMTGVLEVLDTVRRNADLTAQRDELRELLRADSDKPDAEQRRAWDEKIVEHMVGQFPASSGFVVRTSRAEPLFRRLDELCRYLLRNLDKEVVWTSLDALFKQPVSDSRVALTKLLQQLKSNLQSMREKPEFAEGFNLTSMTLENVEVLTTAAMYLHCPDPSVEDNETYTKLSFHQQVSFYALYTAVVKLQTKKPYELWTMILASISYTSGAVRGDLLRHLSMNSGERGSVPFPSLATPPTITLALESHSPDELFSTERVVETTEEARQYRVRLTSSEATAVLTESVRSVNVRSIDESLAGLDMLLDRGDANGAEMNYLRSLGTSLGEDIVHRLRDRLQGHRDVLAPESPGGRVHLKLRIPRELMRYPWELMSDGYGLLAERFAVGRQVWHNSGVARPPTRCDLPLRVLIVGDPALRAPYSSDAQLPGAREEARAVANLFEALDREMGPAMDFQRERDVFINTVLTRGAMRELLRDRGYDIVHFAGHGRFQPGHPERSAWVLSDGPLWASELYNTFTWTKSPPWLIYANACEAGMSAGRASSAYTGEVFGLAAACINQGVAAYIAPLWRISDTAGRLMATEFYRALLQRRSTLGVSLLDAREYTQRVLREVPDPFGYFDISWASVALYGDPSVRLHDTVGRSI